MKRILRYLAGTPTHGIFLSRDTPLSLHAFSDSDWAGDSDDLVSTNSYVVYLGQNLISWSSKKEWLNPPLKRNTEQLQTHPLSFCGSAHYLLNLASLFSHPQSSTVIILEQHIFVQTRSSIHE